MTILSLRNVNKVFGDPDNGTALVPAVDNVSLDVQSGEFFSIIGPSGCGKSTLLRIIGGLLTRLPGELTVARRGYGPHPWVAMVFQEESTFPWRTTLANVEFGLEMRGVPGKTTSPQGHEMIGLVGLVGFRAALSIGALRRHEAAGRDCPSAGPRA